MKYKIINTITLVVAVFCVSLCLFLTIPNTKASEESGQPESQSVVMNNYGYSEDEIVYADGDTTGASVATIYDKAGVIYLGEGANYTMDGGLMANQSAKYGGAVYISSGATFTMNSGKITGCEAEFGGAIYVESGGFCYINGGEITGNISYTATIFVESGGTLFVDESARIYDNIRREKGKINIYVDEILVETIEPSGQFYEIKEEEMPLSYENCCGYFLDPKLSKTIKNDAVDLTNGGVNLYTRTSIDPESVSCSYDEDLGVYVFDWADCYEGKLVIPKEYDGNQIEKINNEAFYYGCEYTNIVLPAGLTSVGDSAFYCCCSIESFVIPDSVTTIGSRIFDGCSSLTSVIIPEDIDYISDNMFYDCSSLIEIPIHNKIKSIGDSAFYNCSSFDEVVIPASITSIGAGAFSGCNGLTRLKVDSGNSVYDSRNNCNAIIETEENVLVQGCNITDMELVGDITAVGDYAFSSFDGITEIILPATVVDIGSYAFDWCQNLNNISIQNGVISIGDCAFYYCKSLTEIVIPNSVISIGAEAFSSCSQMTNVTLPNNLTRIEKRTFNYCSKLASINIPQSVTYIGEYAFSYCSELTNMILPNNLVGLERYVFDGCQKLETINIPNTVTYINEWAFNNCSKLNNIVIPEAVTTIGRYAFSWCSGLTSMTIPETVVSLGNYIFSRCSSLENVALPSGLTTIGEGTFESCKALKSINLPQNITSIPDTLFRYCENLTNITIPSKVKKIGRFAFDGCKNITEIIIPSSVTTIEDGAFKGMTKLTKIYIPASVTDIKDYSSYSNSPFYNCLSTTIIYCEATSEPSGFRTYWRHYNSTNQLEVVWGASLDEDGNIVSGNNVNFYVNGSLSKTLKVSESTYTLNVDDAPLDYENCCGYFLDSELSKTIKGAIDLSSGSVNLYTKRATNIDNYVIYDYDGYCYVGEGTLSGDVVIPKYYDGYQVFGIEEYAAADSYSLTSITFPDGFGYINSSAFEYCTGLTKLVIPDCVSSIGSMAFANCEELEEVIIAGNGYTSIGTYAFSDCLMLTDLTIGSGVKTINENAFKFCSELSSVYIPSSVTIIKASSASSSPFHSCYSSLVIYCEATSKPSGWESSWNYYSNFSTLTVKWGYTRENYEAETNA